MTTINRLRGFVLLCCCLLVLSACRRDQGVRATLIPTDTPTPRSTPLPTVATEVPLGAAEERPLVVALMPPRSAATRANLERAASAVETALAEVSGLTIKLEWSERPADALGRLCSREGAAWLDAVSYAVAAAQDCGEAVLLIERGQGDTARLGETVQIIAPQRLTAPTLAEIEAPRLCRLNVQDLYTWLVPTMMFEANGFDWVTQAATISDFDNSAALIAAVAAGRCDVAGMAQSDYEDFATDRQRDNIKTFGESVVVPFGVLAVPTGLALTVRTAFVDAWLSLTSAAENADLLRTLLNADDLEPATTSDLAAWGAFVRSTRLNLERLDQ